MPHPSEYTPVESRTARQTIDVAAARRAARVEQNSFVLRALRNVAIGAVAAASLMTPGGRTVIDSAASHVTEIARDLAPDGSWGSIPPEGINETRQVVEERVRRNSGGLPNGSDQLSPQNQPPSQQLPLNRAG